MIQLSTDSENNRIQVPVIGIPVDIGTIQQAARDLTQLSIHLPKSGAYVCVANAHMLTLAKKKTDFENVLQNSVMVTPDGMPLVWAQRLKGFKKAERICGPDLMIELCKICASEDRSIYLFGGHKKANGTVSQSKNCRLLCPRNTA